MFLIALEGQSGTAPIPHAKISDFGGVRLEGQPVKIASLFSPDCMPPHSPMGPSIVHQSTDLWCLADLIYTIRYGESLFVRLGNELVNISSMGSMAKSGRLRAIL